MKLSYVIVTRNRRDSLLQTLGKLEQNTHLSKRSWEAVVVDNASDDGSPEAVAKMFRSVRLVRLPENEGMPGRNHGFKIARGRYVCCGPVPELKIPKLHRFTMSKRSQRLSQSTLCPKVR